MSPEELLRHCPMEKRRYWQDAGLSGLVLRAETVRLLAPHPDNFHIVGEWAVMALPLLDLLFFIAYADEGETPDQTIRRILASDRAKVQRVLESEPELDPDFDLLSLLGERRG